MRRRDYGATGAYAIQVDGVAESLRTRLTRIAFNFFPAYRGTGARITYIAHDWSEVRVKLPLNWRTRNYVGTIFGGSMFGAADPLYMVMLIKRLGPSYVVWDKTGYIRFRRPGRGTLRGTFTLPDEEIREIKQMLDHEPKIERTYAVSLVDDTGEVHAAIEKIIQIRRSDRDRVP